MTALLFIKILLLTTLVCCGLTAASGEGMILEGVKNRLQSLVDRGLFPSFVAKPLLLCVTCMSSLWTTIIFWTMVHYHGVDRSVAIWLLWAAAIPSVAFLNTFAYTAYLYLEHHGNPSGDHIQHPGSAGRLDPE